MPNHHADVYPTFTFYKVV